MLDLTDEEVDRYWRLRRDFRAIQNDHWHNTNDELHIDNQLGGYFETSQGAWPEHLAERGLAAFIQIGSDGNANMTWGDAGELTFFADAKAIAKGQFERVWAMFEQG